MRKSAGELGYLHKFHLPIAPAMENKHISGPIAEDKQVAVAKLRLLHRFLHSHRLQGNRFRAL